MGIIVPLQQFAQAIHEKFASQVSGEPEDQLRAPFERLLSEAGQIVGTDVLAIGETLLKDHGGKPDFGISTSRPISVKSFQNRFTLLFIFYCYSM